MSVDSACWLSYGISLAYCMMGVASFSLFYVCSVVVHSSLLHIDT